MPGIPTVATDPNTVLVIMQGELNMTNVFISPLKTLPKATVPSEWCEDPTSMSEYDGTIMFQVQHLPWSRVTPQPRPQLSEIWIQAGVIAPAAPSSRDGENSGNSPGSQNKLQQK